MTTPPNNSSLLTRNTETAKKRRQEAEGVWGFDKKGAVSATQEPDDGED